MVGGKLGIALAHLAPAIQNRGARASSLDEDEDLLELSEYILFRRRCFIVSFLSGLED